MNICPYLPILKFRYSGCAPDRNPWPYGPPLSPHRHICCWSYWLCIHQSHASYLYAVSVLRIRYRYALLCYKLRLKNFRYWLPALALAQSTAPAAVQLWHGAPVAFSARYQLTLFFIVYLVFAPEIFLQGPSFVFAPYSRYASLTIWLTKTCKICKTRSC